MSFRRRLARWRPAIATRALTICALFGVVILSSVYATKDHTTLFQLKTSGASGPTAARAPSLTGSAELDPADPVARFKDTSVGQVLFTSPRGDNCRRVLFDNRTGISYESNDISCGPKPEQVVVETQNPNRFDALRKSFQR
jgi:hypothetical protein